MLSKSGERWQRAKCGRVDLALARKVKSVQWLRDIAQKHPRRCCDVLSRCPHQEARRCEDGGARSGEGRVVHGRLLGDEAVEGTGDDLPDSQAATARDRNDIQQILLRSYSVNRSHKNLITIVVVS